MAKVRVLILRTAGTNCDYETQYAFEKAGAEAERVHINRIVEGSRRLEDFQILAVPGGFSYGDDLGAGKVLANELLSRAKEHFATFAERDHLVIGICNGFQALAKMNLVPGFSGIDAPQEATLTDNDSGKFEDRWVYLKADSDKSPFVKKGDMIYLPVAHGEGKFVTRTDEILERIKENEQVVGCVPIRHKRGRQAGISGQSKRVVRRYCGDMRYDGQDFRDDAASGEALHKRAAPALDTRRGAGSSRRDEDI